MRITVATRGTLAGTEKDGENWTERGSLRHNECGEEDRDGGGGRRDEKRLMWLFCDWKKIYELNHWRVFFSAVWVTNAAKVHRCRSHKYLLLLFIYFFFLALVLHSAKEGWAGLKHIGWEVLRRYAWTEKKKKSFLFFLLSKKPPSPPA